MKKLIIFIAAIIGMVWMQANAQEKALSVSSLDKLPEFEGGQNTLYAFLGANLHYPEAAIKDNAEGRVVVKFVIDKTGEITDVTISKSVHPALDAEAMRVIKAMPRWKPGYLGDKPVKVSYNLPVHFKLPEELKQTTEVRDMVDLMEDTRQIGTVCNDKGIDDITQTAVEEEVKVVKMQTEPTDEDEVNALLQQLKQKVDSIENGSGTLQNSNTDNNDESDYQYNAVEQMPFYPGGEAALYAFIASHIQYPAEAAEEGVEGRVVVSFVIEKDGSISNVKIARGKHPALDKEAIRVVKEMPKWIPGKLNGVPVRVSYNLPVTFKFS